MNVYIVGEDAVSKEVIKRVLSYCSEKIRIISELPARGGQVEALAKKFNNLSKNAPVILLLDSDNDCPPAKLNSIVSNFKKESNFIINIAYDEVESWLMADMDNFSSYFGVPENVIPLPSVISRKDENRKEIIFPLKPSLFMMMEIIPKSTNFEIRRRLTPVKGSKKGPEYNSTMIPFISEMWNVDNAAQNSDSLIKMIKRIQCLF